MSIPLWNSPKFGLELAVSSFAVPGMLSGVSMLGRAVYAVRGDGHATPLDLAATGLIVLIVVFVCTLLHEGAHAVALRLCCQRGRIVIYLGRDGGQTTPVLARGVRLAVAALAGPLVDVMLFGAAWLWVRSDASAVWVSETSYCVLGALGICAYIAFTSPPSDLSLAWLGVQQANEVRRRG